MNWMLVLKKWVIIKSFIIIVYSSPITEFKAILGVGGGGRNLCPLILYDEAADEDFMASSKRDAQGHEPYWSTM